MKFNADIPAQIRQMGRADWLAGVTDCPFGPKSNAAKLWHEGREEAARFPLLAGIREEA
jgi:hypothetical protein